MYEKTCTKCGRKESEQVYFCLEYEGSNHDYQEEFPQPVGRVWKAEWDWQKSFDDLFPPKDPNDIGKDDRFKSFIRRVVRYEQRQLIESILKKTETVVFDEYRMEDEGTDEFVSVKNIKSIVSEKGI